jgi:hypothetical protein
MDRPPRRDNRDTEVAWERYASAVTVQTRRLSAIAVLLSAFSVPVAVSMHAPVAAATRPSAGQIRLTGGIMDEGTKAPQNITFVLD